MCVILIISVLFELEKLKKDVHKSRINNKYRKIFNFLLEKKLVVMLIHKKFIVTVRDRNHRDHESQHSCRSLIQASNLLTNTS